MFANAAQVAAVIGARICAVVGIGRVGGLIVGGIAVGEAVRHDEVNHIRLAKGRETFRRLGCAMPAATRRRFFPWKW